MKKTRYNVFWKTFWEIGLSRHQKVTIFETYHQIKVFTYFRKLPQQYLCKYSALCNCFVIIVHRVLIAPYGGIKIHKKRTLHTTTSLRDVVVCIVRFSCKTTSPILLLITVKRFDHTVRSSKWCVHRTKSGLKTFYWAASSIELISSGECDKL